MHNMAYLVCIHTSAKLYGVEVFENQVALEVGGTCGDYSCLGGALAIRKQKVNQEVQLTIWRRWCTGQHNGSSTGQVEELQLTCWQSLCASQRNSSSRGQGEES
jgi:hypothetical protein